mmetsp:Transcript_15652/g.48999  ORF Transcript_15652/g.48999 Transcript_15652/m.48999 type:complete len:287 (-) Transcript_15652:292-1152(-)
MARSCSSRGRAPGSSSQLRSSAASAGRGRQSKEAPRPPATSQPSPSGLKWSVPRKLSPGCSLPTSSSLALAHSASGSSCRPSAPSPASPAAAPGSTGCAAKRSTPSSPSRTQCQWPAGNTSCAGCALRTESLCAQRPSSAFRRPSSRGSRRRKPPRLFTSCSERASEGWSLTCKTRAATQWVHSVSTGNVAAASLWCALISLPFLATLRWIDRRLDAGFSTRWRASSKSAQTSAWRSGSRAPASARPTRKSGGGSRPLDRHCSTARPKSQQAVRASPRRRRQTPRW